MRHIRNSYWPIDFETGEISLLANSLHAPAPCHVRTCQDEATKRSHRNAEIRSSLNSHARSVPEFHRWIVVEQSLASIERNCSVVFATGVHECARKLPESATSESAWTVFLKFSNRKLRQAINIVLASRVIATRFTR